MRTLLTLPILSLVLLTGCHTTSHFAETVDDYVAASAGIQLGMSPSQVRGILGPTQLRIDNTVRRQDERYLLGDAEIVIQYYRSGWQADGRLTDDEYTPYHFRNGRLVGIGWQLQRSVML